MTMSLLHKTKAPALLLAGAFVCSSLTENRSTPTPKSTGDGAAKAVVIFFSKNVHCTGGKESNDRE